MSYENFTSSSPLLFIKTKTLGTLGVESSLVSGSLKHLLSIHTKVVSYHFRVCCPSVGLSPGMAGRRPFVSQFPFVIGAYPHRPPSATASKTIDL